MVGTPIVHHRVDIPEGSAARQVGDEPMGRPGGVGALIQGVVNALWQVNRVPLRNLQDRAKSLDQVDAGHGDRHAADRYEARRETAPAKVLCDRRIPRRRGQALFHLFRRNLPERLHRRLAVNGLRAGGVQGCCA